MTNVFDDPKKRWMRDQLFAAGVGTLLKTGYTVERVPGAGKSSVRRITKEGESREVSIRTTQDKYIAFPRNKQNTGWITLSEVEAVVAVSVDDKDDPKFAFVHMIDGDEMRDRFERAYAARLAAGHSIPVGRGLWLPLYIADAPEPAVHVGAGAGLKNPAIGRVPLERGEPKADLAARLRHFRAAARLQPGEPEPEPTPEPKAPPATSSESGRGGEPLSIAEAKRQLALSFGVDAASIKITIEA